MPKTALCRFQDLLLSVPWLRWADFHLVLLFVLAEKFLSKEANVNSKFDLGLIFKGESGAGDIELEMLLSCGTEGV